jgi:hypothetical protein
LKIYCKSLSYPKLYIGQNCNTMQERPYHDDSTASRLLSEVKHRRARLVLRWGTTLESRVLFFFDFFSFSLVFRLTTPLENYNPFHRYSVAARSSSKIQPQSLHRAFLRQARIVALLLTSCMQYMRFRLCQQRY